MKIGSVDLTTDVLIIAEIGNNHEGDFDCAVRMIREARKAGANAVKFQTIVPERLVSLTDAERIKQLERFRFSYDQFRRLKEVADAEGVLFLSTPFDLESVSFLNELVPAFKIASGDNDFFPMIELIAKTSKPIILSSGLSDLSGIAKTKAFIEQTWHREGVRGELAILHCVVSYPTVAEQANLLALRHLAELGTTVGYSDHTLGIDAAVLSVALGGRIIEKHFTISKIHSDFRDHKISADPAEMALLVQRVKETVCLLGDGIKRIQPSETEAMLKVRRGIAAGRDLSKGTVLAWQDLGWVRPSGHLRPGQEAQLIGRTLKRPLKQGEPVTLSDLE